MGTCTKERREVQLAERIRSITETTFLPVSLCISLAGGIMWLTTIYNSVAAHEKTLERVEIRQEQYSKDTQLILEKLAKIEGKLGIERGN